MNLHLCQVDRNVSRGSAEVKRVVFILHLFRGKSFGQKSPDGVQLKHLPCFLFSFPGFLFSLVSSFPGFLFVPCSLCSCCLFFSPLLSWECLPHHEGTSQNSFPPDRTLCLIIGNLKLKKKKTPPLGNHSNFNDSSLVSRWWNLIHKPRIHHDEKGILR
ncbi:hypothetical protein BDV28DRAFT_89247 [Aspergillus coremiiformis]|uniref:Uncharacterized protein n=1 Tax=Aspergillus coremiiformis TaxID=138285 RepID=A0A5N6ZA21_9EURO|nr:hypothetical protein BDV28DRAFT_89247 [Aspergillus coremiiformis]